MNTFDYALVDEASEPPVLGLIVLQSEETLEQEVRHAFAPDDIKLHVSRVESGLDVTPDTLKAMAGKLSAAASLFPRGQAFDAVGYACTSGTAAIGEDEITRHVRDGCDTAHVTNPLSALIYACKTRNLKRLAFLSPYTQDVSAPIIAQLGDKDIEVTHFGTFNEATESNVARISPASIVTAGLKFSDRPDFDALFISCTNLRARTAIGPLEGLLGKPVLSSNSVLLQHMADLTGLKPRFG